jgi:hypothetical protein
MDVKRTERGWAAHYCMSDRCMFRRNTLLEYGDIKIIVSTVGNMIYEERTQHIGRGWYYETMAFYAQYDGIYLDANIKTNISFNSKWYSKELDDNMANDMHEDVVRELMQKLLNGEINGNSSEVQDME